MTIDHRQIAKNYYHMRVSADCLCSGLSCNFLVIAGTIIYYLSPLMFLFLDFCTKDVSWA